MLFRVLRFQRMTLMLCQLLGEKFLSSIWWHLRSKGFCLFSLHSLLHLQPIIIIFCGTIGNTVLEELWRYSLASWAVSSAFFLCPKYLPLTIFESEIFLYSEKKKKAKYLGKVLVLELFQHISSHIVPYFLLSCLSLLSCFFNCRQWLHSCLHHQPLHFWLFILRTTISLQLAWRTPPSKFTMFALMRY